VVSSSNRRADHGVLAREDGPHSGPYETACRQTGADRGVFAREDGPHSGPYETLLGAWSAQRTLQNWSRPGEVPLKGGEVGQVRVVVAVEAGGEA
jgi:hypothetical protein